MHLVSLCFHHCYSITFTAVVVAGDNEPGLLALAWYLDYLVQYQSLDSITRVVLFL